MKAEINKSLNFLSISTLRWSKVLLDREIAEIIFIVKNNGYLNYI